MVELAHERAVVAVAEVAARLETLGELLLGALVDYSTLDDWQQSAQSKPSESQAVNAPNKTR